MEIIKVYSTVKAKHCLCPLCTYICLETFISENVLLHILLQTELARENTWSVDFLGGLYYSKSPMQKGCETCYSCLLENTGPVGAKKLSTNKKTD